MRIDYYRPRGDAKEAWDNIDLVGFLGQRMQLKVDFLCRDSHPRRAAGARARRGCSPRRDRRGEGGPQEQLGYFFKAPVTRAGADARARAARPGAGAAGLAGPPLTLSSPAVPRGLAGVAGPFREVGDLKRVRVAHADGLGRAAGVRAGLGGARRGRRPGGRRRGRVRLRAGGGPARGDRRGGAARGGADRRRGRRRAGPGRGRGGGRAPAADVGSGCGRRCPASWPPRPCRRPAPTCRPSCRRSWGRCAASPAPGRRHRGGRGWSSSRRRTTPSTAGPSPSTAACSPTASGPTRATRSCSAWPTTCTTPCCPDAGFAGEMLLGAAPRAGAGAAHRARARDPARRRWPSGCRALLARPGRRRHPRRPRLPRRGRAGPRAAVPPPRPGGRLHRRPGAGRPGAGARRARSPTTTTRCSPRRACDGWRRERAACRVVRRGRRPAGGRRRPRPRRHAARRRAPLAGGRGHPVAAGRARRRARAGAWPRSTRGRGRRRGGAARRRRRLVGRPAAARTRSCARRCGRRPCATPSTCSASGGSAPTSLHRWSDPSWLAALALTAAHPPAGRPVVDLACGAGHLLRHLALHGHRDLTGVDVVFAKLWLARRFVLPAGAPVGLVCADLTAPWPLPPPAAPRHVGLPRRALLPRRQGGVRRRGAPARGRRRSGAARALPQRAAPGGTVAGCPLDPDGWQALLPGAAAYAEEELTASTAAGRLPRPAGRLDGDRGRQPGRWIPATPAAGPRPRCSTPRRAPRCGATRSTPTASRRWPGERWAAEYGPRAAAYLPERWTDAARRRGGPPAPARGPPGGLVSTVGWGIVGCGWVARDHLLPGLRSTPDPARRRLRPRRGRGPPARRRGRRRRHRRPRARCWPRPAWTPSTSRRPTTRTGPWWRPSRPAGSPCCARSRWPPTSPTPTRSSPPARAASLGTAFDQRFHPAHRRIAEMVAAGGLGTVTAVRIVYACWLPPDGARTVPYRSSSAPHDANRSPDVGGRRRPAPS